LNAGLFTYKLVFLPGNILLFPSSYMLQYPILKRQCNVNSLDVCKIVPR